MNNNSEKFTKRHEYKTRVELNQAMKSDEQNWAFETRAILAGQAPDPATGSTIFPIYQTSTYTQAGINDNKGYCYSRTGNPTRTAAADVLASLENGNAAFIYPSGINAIIAVMELIVCLDHNIKEPQKAPSNNNPHIVVSSDLYGGAHRIFDEVYTPKGYKFDFVDTREIKNITDAITDETRLVWLESPTNPLMRLCDIEATVKATKAIRPDILVGIDSTFATPFLQRPLDMGVDIVMHSCTKYLGGHSDVLIGGVVVKDEKLADKLGYLQNASGAVAGPLDCWILLKGMKTLAVRMRQHHANCEQIAEWLEKHPQVRAVHCPLLESHPQHELYKKQMDAYNGMLSFEFDGDLETVKKLVSNTKIFQFAESLGGVESLICQPASTTHAAVHPDKRKALGINDNLIRISIGIEDAKDLIADLEYAFTACKAPETAAIA